MASPTPLLLVWWHAPIECFQPKLGPSQSRQQRVSGQVPHSHRRLDKLLRPRRIPKPVPIHPSHHTASRMRNLRCKQQIQSNAHSLVSLTPRATLRTRSSPAWLAVVKFPVRHTVWSITSRDDHSRQPSGPSCKRFKTTALHNVTTTRASHAEHHVAERPAHSPSSSLLVPRVFSGLVPAHPA